jgi:hypothetical protein
MVIVLHISVYHVNLNLAKVYKKGGSNTQFKIMLLVKDGTTIVIVAGVLIAINITRGTDPENFNVADPMFSPVHIKPE